MATTDSPDVILAEVLSGSVEKYEEIIRAYQQDVYRVVATARLDWASARDIVQRTFVQAYLHLDSYRSGTHFGAWLKGIARNLVREELRRNSCKQRHLQIYRDEVERGLDGGAQADLAADHRLEALRHCRKRLPESYAQIVELYYSKPLAIQELAEATGRTAEAAKQMLWRARLMLRQCVDRTMARA